MSITTSLPSCTGIPAFRSPRRRSWFLRAGSLLLPLVGIALAAPDGRAQSSFVADVGTSYELNDDLSPGRAPFRMGHGTYRLTDGRLDSGELRLTVGQHPWLMVKDAKGRQKIASTQLSEFTIEGHQYVPAKGLVAINSAVQCPWIESLVAGPGPWRLYEVHGQNHVFVFLNSTTHAQSMVKGDLPPRGYDDEFDAQLRSALAVRPDIVQFVDGHHIKLRHLPGVVQAFNSGQPYDFK